MPERELRRRGWTAPFFLVSSFTGRHDRMVRHDRRAGRKALERVLGIAACSLVFTASHVWAAPFTGAMEGLYTANPFPGPDGTFSRYDHTIRLQGYTTTGGARMCNGETVSSGISEPPTGACGAEEIEAVGTIKHYCQFEGTEGVFHSTGEATVCIPLSCLGETFLYQEGCSYTFTERVTATGGSGIAAGSSGSWTFAGTGTFTQVGPKEVDGLPFLAETVRGELQGDFELADGSVAPDGATLEIPSPGTNVSGIGLISGWSCLGGELAVEFSDADGVIETMTVLHGTERLDTEPVCGDITNGFSATCNWSRLGAGEKTARLIRNGEEVASHPFMVTAFPDEDTNQDGLLEGASGMCTVADLPVAGKNATFVWEQSQQGLVLEAVN